MKKVLKIILKMIMHFTIFILASLLILFILEKFLGRSDDSRWNDYNGTVNSMNYDKLYDGNYINYDFYWLYKDEELKPKGNKKRILVLGDSFVWGDGYSNANIIWWQKLRRKLIENGYNDVEIVAMGRNSLNTYEELLMLKHNDIKNKIDPDLIIFGWVENDLHPVENDNHFDIYPAELDIRINWNPFANYLPPFLSSFLLDKFPHIYRNLTNKFCEMSRNPEYNFGVYDGMSFSEPYLELYEKSILTEVKSYIEDELNIPFFFVITPHDYGDYYDFKVNKVKPIFEKLNIKFYDELKDLTFDEKLSDISPVNGHPGPKPTEYISNYVLKILEEDYKNIIGKKTKVVDQGIIINDPMPRSIGLEKIEDNVFTFKYPEASDESSLLKMPIEDGYIKLNFMFPVDIKTIEITGEDVKNIDIYINKENKELGYDDLEFFEIKNKKDNVWEVNEEKVTTINVHADIKNGKSSELKIKIN